MTKKIFTAAWTLMLFACCQLAAAATSISVAATPANATAPANVTLSVSVNAGSEPMTITQVEYFHGSSSLGIATDAPYSLTLPNMAAGTYAIVAKASTTDPNNPVLQSAPAQVVVALPAGSATAYFIHIDQLNTPRAISNGSGALVWQWDSDPFGKDAPNEQPAGQAAFVFNQRFPGQQFDRESNFHYNYFRDYDPALGRYVQSDPIGLYGGLNTYGYVDGDPVSKADPFGLAPGDPYKSVDAAGKQAIRDINPTSIARNQEFAGRIYRRPDGAYSYTKPIPGKRDSADFGVCPPDMTNAGQYHTHGADSKGKNWDYVFSNSDMSWAEKENVPSYLGIPDGRILKYTPIPGAPPRSGPAIVIGRGAK